MPVLYQRRTFRNGFVRGFTAPFYALYGGDRSIGYSPTATDHVAWHEVGSLLNGAYREVAIDVDKASRKTPSQRRNKRG